MKNLLLTLIILSSYTVFSQSKQEKYWFYRKRLTDYFVQIGHNPGESVVVERRNDDNTDDENKRLKPYYNMSSIGFKIGIKYNFKL